MLSLHTRHLKDQVIAHSGPGGANIRIFTALKGELVCSTRLHSPKDGRLEEPAWLGTAISFGSEHNTFYVLSNGNTVTKINDKCEKLWTWKSPDER